MTATGESIITVTILGAILAFGGLGVSGATSVDGAIHAVEHTDPISGLHWQRIKDHQHPSAPPKLALVNRSEDVAGGSRQSAVCVRAGDLVLLHGTNGTSAEISLKATALTSGVRGDRIRARVAVTGAAVEMTVIGPGAGAIVGKTGAW